MRAIQNKFSIKTSRATKVIIGGIFILIGITTLTATILAHTTGGAYTGISKASAVSTIDSVTIDVEDSCTLSGDIDDDKEHTISVSSGTYTKDIGETTLNAICNDPNGYSVYAIGYGNDTDGNTDLTGTTTGLTIPTGTSTDTTISNWSMKLSAVTGTYTPTILSDTNGSYANYHIVPSIYTKVFTYTNDVNTTNTSQAKTTYAVAVTNSQSPDTYIGKVKYLLVHPNYSNPDGTLETYSIPITFAGDGVASVTITTDDPNVTPSSQTITTSGSTATMTAGVPYTLTMSFNNNYEFDSWSLNDSSYGTLSSTTTNPTTFMPNANSGSAIITATGKESAPGLCTSTATCMQTATTCDTTLTDARDGNTYTVKTISSKCWMTQNLRFTWTSNDTLTSDTTHVSGNTKITVGALTSGDSYTEARIQYNNNTSYGAYYNYCAASAGTVCSQTKADASYDICPKGWRLPTNSEFSGITSQASAFSPVYSEFYYGGRLGSTVSSSYGYWWSATAYSASYQYYLYYYRGVLSTSRSYVKCNGYSVRCVRI